jgi:hypothetical protein
MAKNPLSGGSNGLPIGLVVFFGVAFIAFGDAVLPPVVGQYSYQTRTALNQMMINAFPSFKPKNNPYGRTEDALKKNE